MSGRNELPAVVLEDSHVDKFESIVIVALLKFIVLPTGVRDDTPLTRVTLEKPQRGHEFILTAAAVIGVGAVTSSAYPGDATLTPSLFEVTAKVVLLDAPR
jgi:hypothetical protein